MNIIVRKFSLLISFIILLNSYTSAKAQSADNKIPRNVIVIMGDDVGYGDLSCYGARAIKTPNIDETARRGIRFTDAHTTAATCTPSRYSLFTGQYNWRKKGTGILPGDAAMIIDPEQTTLADIFKNGGYFTGAIGKWHLGLGDRQGAQDWNRIIAPGLKDLGFDYSFIMAATGDRVPCVWIENQKVYDYDVSAPIAVSYKEPFPGEPLGKDHPELLTNLKPSINHGHNQAIVNGISRIGYMKGGGKALWQDESIADTIAIKSAQFIENNKSKPFFLYVGTNDIHVPRYPNSRFRGKSGMGYRGDALLQFDWTVGEIIKSLKKNNLLENTLVILSSDNGPVLDDGYMDKAEELLGNHRPWGMLHPRGGKSSNFEAGTRVPFILSWPAQVKPGVSSALISQIDLSASMAALLNQKIPVGQAPDSQDMLAALLGHRAKGRQYLIESASSLSVSDGRWKYIEPSKVPPFYKLTNTETGSSEQDQLYDLHSDIAEQHNVANRYPRQVGRLKELIEKEKAKGFQR